MTDPFMFQCRSNLVLFDKTEGNKFMKTWVTSWVAHNRPSKKWELERLEIEGNMVKEYWVETRRTATFPKTSWKPPMKAMKLNGKPAAKAAKQKSKGSNDGKKGKQTKKTAAKQKRSSKDGMGTKTTAAKQKTSKGSKDGKKAKDGKK